MKKDNIDYLVGKTIEDATELLKALDITLRIVKINNRPCVITMDFRFDRLNVHVENGIIVKVEDFG